MPYYLARAAFEGKVGRTTYQFVPGDAVELVDPAHVASFINDRLLDLSRPLTPAEADEARAKRAAGDAAERERDAERGRVLRAHVRAWGFARCPGHGAHGPHDTPVIIGDERSGLRAEFVDYGDAGSWWVVGCSYHMPRLVKLTTPPEEPPTVDREVRRYRVLASYSAAWPGTTSDIPPDLALRADGRVDLVEGTTVPLPGHIAQWVQRDGGDILEPVDIAEPTGPQRGSSGRFVRRAEHEQ